MSIDLSAIEARTKRRETSANPLAALHSLCDDIPALIAEVRRLQSVEAGAAQMREALEYAQKTMHWHCWDNPEYVPDRECMEAKASDGIARALSTDAGDALLKERDAAIHERESCHALYDDILTLCGYSKGQGYPGIVGAVEKLKAERDELRAKLAEAVRERDEALEKLNWQNKRNSGLPTRGGYEFYINEEWVGLAMAGLDDENGGCATLMKARFDPDDERVRVRRVIEDDAILSELTAARELADRMGSTAMELHYCLAHILELNKVGSGEMEKRGLDVVRFPRAETAVANANKAIADWRAGKDHDAKRESAVAEEEETARQDAGELRPNEHPAFTAAFKGFSAGEGEL